MHTISMTQDVYDSILTTIGVHAPETGGILASDPVGIVRAFHFDCPTQRSSITYTPSIHTLSTVINEIWLPQGLVFSGLVHSHPKPSPPSPRDIRSALEIMRLNSLSVFLLPIVAGHQIDMYVLYLNPDDCFQLTKEIIHIMR